MATKDLANLYGSDSMAKRSDGGGNTASVLDSIHKIKVYNAAPGAKEDKEKAGFILVKNSETEGKYEPLAESVDVNILSIKKVLSGSYIKLDSKGEMILDNNRKPEKGFAYTNEFNRFTRNSDNILFKDLENPDKIIQLSMQELKDVVKKKEINGVKNKFYKQATDFNGVPYDSSYINYAYAVYGIFLSGRYKGEYFKMIMSPAAFGSKYDRDTKKFISKPGSLDAAINKAQKEFKDLGVDGYFSDSFLRATLSVVKESEYFKPEFKSASLLDYNNQEDYEFIKELQEAYDKQEFPENKISGNKSLGYAQPALDSGALEEEPEEAEVEKPETKRPKPKEEEISIEDIPF